MAKGRTSRGTWKAFERTIAKFFGVARSSKRRQGESVPDVIAPARLKKKVLLMIECKLRAKMPKFITDVMGQSERNAAGRGIPIVIVKEKHDLYDNAVVFMSWESFKRMCRK